MKDILQQLWQPYPAFIIGVLLAFTVGAFIAPTVFHHNHHGTTHPIGYSEDGEVHVHADWLVQLNGTTYDFSGDQYQTTATQELSNVIHLHDNNGLVIHRHDHDVTMALFLESLGFTLTDTCITTDQDETYCSNETNQLVLYVNGEATPELSQYVAQEADRLLLYYGPTDEREVIAALQSEVSDLACIYSGTCPERGTPPPEACGLTCDL
jgi:hypothetical protein